MKNVMSRVMFCGNKHDLSKEFVVFGTSKQKIHQREILKYTGLIEGFTPHLISWEKKGDKYELTICCGIVGCGCSIHNDELYIDKAVTKTVTEKEFEDLKLFKNTGYELDRS
jgi:hypothetical protein